MDLNITSAITELKTFTDALGLYHAELAAYLEDPNLIPPTFLTVTFPTADSLSTATLTSNLSSNAIGGYLVDHVHNMGAAEREIGIRYASKSSYYLNGVIAAQLESDNYNEMNAEYSTAFRGNIIT